MVEYTLLEDCVFILICSAPKVVFLEKFSFKVIYLSWF